MYKGLWSCKKNIVCFCGVALTLTQGRSHSLHGPWGNDIRLWLWGSTRSFLVARTRIPHLRADQYIHCCHPSHMFKTSQAVRVWWINHGQSAIGSLRHWNLLNFIAGRTANNKSPVTCGLTFSQFWGLLFYSEKPKIFIFYPHLSAGFMSFLSAHTHGWGWRRRRGGKGKILCVLRRHVESTVLIEELHETFPK